jgi:ribosomal-protein-alanine N-acetyltransferase
MEVFYELISDARGQGLASQALTCLCNWALHHGARQVTAKIEPINEASRRVLERGGFRKHERDSGYEQFVVTKNEPLSSFGALGI